jgi:hypothetical protein
VHKEEVNLLDIADEELLEAIWEKVAGLKRKAGDLSICYLAMKRGSFTFLLLP